MGGIRDLRRVQLGKEIYGYAAAVTPTAQLVGALSAVENRNRLFPAEASGIMSSHRRSFDQAVQAQLGFDAGDEGATFEQLIILLSMCVQGGVAAVAVPPNGYLWTFSPDLAAGDRPDIYTMRYGDNQQCWESEGVFGLSMVLGAAVQESWKVTAEMLGDQMAPAEFAAGVTYPTPLETILAQMTTIYLDGTWAALGTTPVDATLIDWELTIPGFHAKFFQDGQMTYSDIGLASRSFGVRMTLEFNGNAAAEWLDWRAATPRFLRLLAMGSQINAGPPIDNHFAQIDMAIIWDSYEYLDERDGNDIMRFTGRTIYDPTGTGHEFEFQVQNTIDDLP